MYFEGAEKKLEIYLRPECQVNLLHLGRDYWKQMVESVNAQILSSISNESCDAFLLSESSLFVYESTFTMITCGTTQLVRAAELFLQKFPSDQVEAVFYERKNEIFGHYQPSHFFDDVEVLKKYVDGKAYRFGEESEHHIYLFATNSKFKPKASDCTQEVLMNGLQGPARDIFLSNKKMSGEELRERIGLSSILDGYIVDDFVFQPCGYSLNALKDDYYVTIHVTPEAVGSYISFETNAAPQEVRKNWLETLLSVFKPKSFDIFVFDESHGDRLTLDTYVQKSQYRADLECGFKVQFNSFFQPQPEAEAAFEYK